MSGGCPSKHVMSTLTGPAPDPSGGAMRESTPTLSTRLNPARPRLTLMALALILGFIALAFVPAARAQSAAATLPGVGGTMAPAAGMAEAPVHGGEANLLI